VLSKRLSLTTDNTYNDLRKKNLELQEAYDQLKDAHLQILEKERLERELQVARNIQMSILPDRLPFLQDFDFGYKIEPARQVGGDFFDVLQLDEDTTAVFVGDVADKGVPSAIFMARAHALLTAESGLDVSPTSVLRRVNSHLTKMERSDQFVTVLYGILYRKTRLFKYARAGHEVPLLVMPEGQIHRMAHVNGMALGLFEDINLDEQVVRIPPGGTLLIYTDGMTDGRNPQGEPFGLARLQSTLGGLVGKPAQDTCDLLMETMTCYRAEVPQDDDVTLVAIHAG
jgi:phosphoserine phosphatase RsbU/P